MKPWKWFVSSVGGQRTLLALGGLFVVFGVRETYVDIMVGTPVFTTLLFSLFLLGPGAVLLYGGYRLPRTDIKPAFYSTVTAWCLGAILLMTGLLLLYHLLPGDSISEPLQVILIISGFVAVPAYAGGVNNARAQTQAFELEQRNQRLQRIQSELEQSNERLEQFAYAASHDLQEPLRMVSSYLQLIEERAGNELTEETEEFLEFAVDGADRMSNMIKGLLAYSRVDSTGEPLEPVDLDEVMADVRRDLEIQITEHDAEVTIGELPHVRGDETQLGQVFQNLVRNAIQYSGDEPPRVHISAERIGTEWEISVHDEGVGIDPAEQDRIFDVFKRLTPRSEHPGSGIGLALCERIVERHGGEIWVDSAPGEGSTFSITLPAVGGRNE